MQSHAQTALSIARSLGMFIVIDADALILVSNASETIKGYRKAILTPNVVEFKRLSESLGVGKDAGAQEISKALGGVAVLQKGAKDVVSADTTGETSNDLKENVHETIEVDIEGGLKRCGGQGDILSGAIGAFLAWGKCYEDGAYGDHSIPTSSIPLFAGIGGSMVTRTTSRIGFKKHGRGLVTQDLVGEVAGAFEEVFGEHEGNGSYSNR